MTVSLAFTRRDIADHVLSRLEAEKPLLREAFSRPGRVPSCCVDDLLPQDLTASIHAAFPDRGRMMFKKSLKERKFVGAQMDAYAPILEEAVYAFQDARVVEAISQITGLQALEPDAELYAGGVSAMPKGAYLKPHLDNSHDKDRARYRVLNLLFYVTPDWQEAYGGNLQLWDDGPRGKPRTIPALFNRLVLMATNRISWHSVQEVRADGARCCVSNYYFSRQCPDRTDYFHATSFRGEPSEGVSDVIMRTDNVLRTAVLKSMGSRLYSNPHVYKRRPNDDPARGG